MPVAAPLAARWLPAPIQPPTPRGGSEGRKGQGTARGPPAGSHASLGRGTNQPGHATELQEAGTSQGCGREMQPRSHSQTGPGGAQRQQCREGIPPSTALVQDHCIIFPEMGSERVAVKGCLA